MSDAAETAHRQQPEAAGAAPGAFRIPRRARDEPAPLSFAQERLWFLDQLEPGSATYNIPLAMELGQVDIAALSRSLNCLVERHEVFRTTIAMADGRPVQRIAPELDLALPVLTCDGADDAARRQTAQALATEEARRPFDLAAGPLVRARLYVIGEGRALLLVVIHHIIADAWSIGVFTRDLAELYREQVTGERAQLPPLPIHYADFAAWQRSMLDGGPNSPAMRYWTTQLAGLPPVLELPTDRPRGASQSAAGGVERFSIPAALAERLWRIAADEHATLFMAALTVFALQLRRYADQTDIAVGTPIASRDRAEVENAIGLFLNTLVLRIRIDDRTSFRELLRQVRDVCVGAYAHQDVPFEYLVEELKPARNLGANPIFQILFVFQGAGAPGEATGDASPDGGFDIVTGTAKFDLSLYLADSGAGLAGTWEYRAALFDRESIARMSGHFTTLLHHAMAAPDRPCSELPMVTPAESAQLTRWNSGSVPQDPRCPHQLFEDSAERMPAQIALLLDGEAVRYDDLNRRANRLAHHLRRLGVGPEVPVGICVERSVEMVVGLLAILKAGGVHVPLDPAFPAERLAFMARDVGFPVLLTQERLVALLPEGLEASIFRLDADWPAVADEPSHNPDCLLRPDNLLYILYTSGSTGRPKGARLNQATLTSLVHWQNRIAPTSPGARTLQFMSFSFDVSFIEIFATFAAGGTLVLCHEDVRRDMAALSALLVDARIERAFLPFTALQQLAHHAVAADVGGFSLADMISTGEALVVTEDIRRFFGRLGACRLHNNYGPTETHWVTWYSLEGDPRGWPALPPIGRCVDNARVMLLDSMLHLVPVGVPGDLYAGGLALARDYLNRPALTAERFLPDAHSEVPGARLYRTGDRARLRPDGTIEYLGRNDDQVKIRGFRVELGEIEAALSKNPDVMDAAVVAREAPGGDRQLIAYVRPRAGVSPLGSELRAVLAQQLPSYMLPGQFVCLDAFPLSATGKVDRRRLPDPGSVRPELRLAYVAPRNEVEEALERIWARVLGLEKIGVEDDFFELGGHSLLAMQVMTRVRDAFELELPVRILFEYPTIAEMGIALVEHQIAALSDAEADALLAEIGELSDEDVEAALREAEAAPNE
ncbi:MAG: hypothetical protein QOD42_1906 [Sphingomonadales bacterium]|jgi:amino acid adenylation domain-containing protein|nr:hypothetical protein [Sphingomonadales bacterium]